MKITLGKLLQRVSFDNPIRVQILDKNRNDYAIDKLIADFGPEDFFLYDLPVESMGVNIGYNNLEIWVHLEVNA